MSKHEPTERPSSSLEDAELTAAIRQSESGQVAQAQLKTDKRVLARVTDGIYREPSSALRELISNCYDADATEVVVQTDRPRFKTISVRDNGNGMSPEALARMILHIGGSAKRLEVGSDLNITQAGNASRSPGGRRLIGRIGIGLFSVSQLTHSFQIITKIKDDPWRTVAMVRLRTYDDNSQEGDSTAESSTYEAGLVSLWRVPADDTDEHGTTIVLTALRQHAVRTLQSQAHWHKVAIGDAVAPRFHVGRVEGDKYVADHDVLDALPWRRGDEPNTAFAKFVRSIQDQTQHGTVRNPSLEHLCDEYLRTVWQLALAAPLPYLAEDPFDLGTADASLYVLTGAGPDSALEVNTGTLATNLGPSATGKLSTTTPFRVFVDDLELRRPLIFKNLPATSHALKKPLLFGGICHEEFGGRPPAESGGPLRFSGYVLWAPKIAPLEHNGVLVRVHDASGTLFDRTFATYQIAERTRLAQLSCEIFVQEGFEAALNIDREGVNEAHPHAQRLSSWLHTAISRAINQQKALANQVRRVNRSASSEERRNVLAGIARTVWQEVQRDASEPPPVEWSTSPTRHLADAILLDSDRVVGPTAPASVKRARRQQIEAIAQILAAYNLINDMTDDHVSDLLAAIAQVIGGDA